MKNYRIKRYEKEDYIVWNAFVGSAKNATFLFHRDFMEYHSDRFEDFSLMVYDDEKLVSVLPANRTGDKLYSHQGLTYGGFVLPEKIRLPEVLGVVEIVLRFLFENQISIFQLKCMPPIYNQSFSDEVLYAMFLAEAQLIRRDCLSVIDLSNPFDYSDLRKRGVKKGIKNNLQVREENTFNSFWNEILIPNLEQRFKVQPVHALEEITRLYHMFPQNIRQFNVYHNNKIVAGTTVFVTDKVAHCQYISGNEQKQELGSLDYLFEYMISKVFSDKSYFDFGISNENQGRVVNEGLLHWKEGFGARSVVQDFYEVKTGNYSLLQKVLQ